MMKHDTITPEVLAGVEMAAKQLDVPRNVVLGYFRSGDTWESDTAEDLAEEIIECWREQAKGEESED